MAQPVIPAPDTIRHCDPTRSQSARRHSIERQQAIEFTAFMDNLAVLRERCEQMRREDIAFRAKFIPRKAAI